MVSKIRKVVYWRLYSFNSRWMFLLSRIVSLCIKKPERKYWLMNQRRIINSRRDRDQEVEFEKILEKKLQDDVITERGAKILRKDFRKCAKKYGIVAEEYYSLDMFHRTAEERERIVSRNRQFHIVASLCTTEKRVLVDDKLNFISFFKEYLGRETLIIKNCPRNDFDQFVKKFDSVIIKPGDSMSGRGIYRITPGEMSSNEIASLWSDLRGRNYLIEECIQQKGILHEICPDSVNTIRVTTLNNGKNEITIPFAFLRTGRLGKCVDNLHAGGIVWPVDHVNGRVSAVGYNTNGDEYEVHPDTGVTVVGLNIPNWEKAIETVTKAAMLLPEVKMIGWDVCISESDIFLIEGNCSTGFWRPYSKDYDLWGFMKNWMDTTLGEDREMRYF